MNKILAFAGAGFALCSTLAFADPDPTVVPLDNAAATVGAKAAENPDNRGLANALEHIVVDNIPRQQAKRDNHPPGQNKAEGLDRPQTAERADRPDRVDRPDKPDRPDRSVRAGIDRPVPPGHAK